MDERNPLNKPSSGYYQILEASYQKYGFDNAAMNRAMEKSYPKKHLELRISDEELKRLKREYPAGSQVELLKINDVRASPVAAKGTVLGVDCIGYILVDWG